MRRFEVGASEGEIRSLAMKLFFDTNVLLDVLLNRAQFVVSSKAALALCAKGQHQGCFSALSACDMVYILGRCGLSGDEARKAVCTLSEVVEMLPIKPELVRAALVANARDFEDMVQQLSAKEYGADIILTRNKSDFFDSEVAVMTPTEFLDSNNTL